MKELSYIDENGNSVFTSQYLRNRKTCCKSACLHCPYGFTLKKYKIQKVPIDSSNEKIAIEIFESFFSTTTQSLFASAFNEKQKTFDPHKYVLLVLKNSVCGLFDLDENKTYLKEHFRDQQIESFLV